MKPTAKASLLAAALVALYALPISSRATDIVRTYSGNLPATQTVLFHDANLLALKGMSLDIQNTFGTILRYYTLSDFREADDTEAGIYLYENDGSVATAQFQWANGYSTTLSSAYFNGLKLCLVQVGNNIEGYVDKVVYSTSNKQYGVDITTMSSGGCTYYEQDIDTLDSKATFSTSCKNLALTFAETESHTVTFLDWNGTTLDTQTVAYGASATAPAAPSRSGFIFVGWDIPFTSVTENLTVTALYHALYTVTFLDADGTTLASQTVEEMTAAPAPDMTGRTYNGNPFSGWDTDFSAVSGNLTVTALYAPVPNQVQVAIAAGSLPAGALIWGGDDGDTWDASSFNWYTTGGLSTLWQSDAIAVFPTSGAVRVSGAKNVGGFVVTLGADVALTGDDLALASGAEAVFNTDGSLVLSNDVVCADGMVQRVRDAHDAIQSLEDSVYLSASEERIVLPSSVRLSEISTLKCKVDSYWNPNTTTREIVNTPVSDREGFYKWEYDSATDTATCQLKICISGSFGTIVTCVKLRFTQKSDGILAIVDYVKSALGSYDLGVQGNSSVWEIDFDNAAYRSDGKVKEQNESLSNYHVRVYDFSAVDVDELPTDVRVTIAGDFDGSLVVSNGVFEAADDATLSGGNYTKSIVTWNDGTILFGSSRTQTLVADIQNKGTGNVKLFHGSALSLKEPSANRAWNFLISGDASATGYKTLPADSGSTTVLPGGSLTLNSFESFWGPSGGAPLIVQTNGLLRLLNENSIGVSKPIYLEGGTLSNEVNKANILYQLYMNDGAKVSGSGFQVGFTSYYGNWSFINAGGSLPSLIDAESLMVGFQVPADSGKPVGVKFIVADVTGDDESDLVVDSPITEKEGVTLFNEGYRDNLGIWKQGPGTLELTATNNACATGVFKIEAGTVKFASTAGGSFGAVVLLGDATLAADAGARVTFDDSSDQAWTAGATLDVAKPLSSHAIRFGTSANALTAAQLAQMTYGGKSGKLSLDADGYLCGPGESTTILLR